MNNHVFKILLFTFAVECHTPDIQNNPVKTENIHETTHFNLIFAPDLSNRISTNLHRSVLKDPDLLSIITQNLYPAILRHRRAENQLDKFRIDFINKGQISLFGANTENLFIDFGKFRNQGDRIAYILGRNGVTQTFRKDTSEMNAAFSQIYRQAQKKQSGSDIWNYLHQGIDDKKIIGQEVIVANNNIYVNTFRNILILVTDGYLEAGIFNKGFDLSQKTINRFRNSFKESGEADIKAYFRKNTQFRIKPADNPNLKNLEILVMELHDRSLTPAGTTTVQPTDLEIIRLFWEEWFRQSNVKRFDLRSCAGSRHDAEQIIMDFIGVKRMI